MLNVTIYKKIAGLILDVNFTITSEITVLFGASGSGKTTILNSIAGLIKPDKGKIALDDKVFFDEKGINLPISKRKIGYLFQDYALFPHMTVKNNILYGTKYSSIIQSQLIQQLITVMKIAPLLDQYPKQLSGGEKQRVALARALAVEPELLLLDEPFSALDAEIRQECHEELLRLHQLWNIPILLVTHDYDEAKKLGDKILYIERGEIKSESHLNAL